MKIRISVLLAVLLLSGCGGGGGGDAAVTPPPTATQFTIDDPVLASVGGVLTFNMNGTMNYSTGTLAATMSLTLAREADEVYNGITYKVASQWIVIQVTSTGAVETAGTYVWTEAATGNFDYASMSNGVVCDPTAFIGNLPASATIGASGNLTGMACSDGNTYTSNWTLESSSRGASYAELHIFQSSGAGFSELVRTINTSGNTVGLEMHMIGVNPSWTADFST